MMLSRQTVERQCLLLKGLHTPFLFAKLLKLNCQAAVRSVDDWLTPERFVLPDSLLALENRD
jgi:hypothetical protein